MFDLIYDDNEQDISELFQEYMDEEWGIALIQFYETCSFNILQPPEM